MFFGAKGEKLTAVNLLGCLLLLLAGVVLGRLLDGETGFGAGDVEIALVVHSLLERVSLPAEDVITVGGGTTEKAR